MMIHSFNNRYSSQAECNKAGSNWMTNEKNKLKGLLCFFKNKIRAAPIKWRERRDAQKTARFIVAALNFQIESSCNGETKLPPLWRPRPKRRQLPQLFGGFLWPPS
jgi:hypothetical protein